MYSLFDKIEQTKYLSEGKADIYRPICRLLFQKTALEFHGSMYTVSEILADLKQRTEFEGRFMDLTEKELDDALKSLEKWGNVLSHQDTSKAKRIEELKNRRSLYSITDITIELERMIGELQNSLQSIRGIEFERHIPDRMMEELDKLKNWKEGQTLDLRIVWKELMDRFKSLQTESSNFFAQISRSSSNEELMRTASFLAYKEKFVQMLQNFVLVIMDKQEKVRQYIHDIPDDVIQRIVELIVTKEAETDLTGDFSAEESRSVRLSEWQGLKGWFIEINGKKPGVRFLIDQAKNTIVRVVKIAEQITDRYNHFKSRKNDCLQLARLFASVGTIEECHRLSAYVFGVQQTYHLYTIPKRSDDHYDTVWEYDPHEITLNKNKPGRREGKIKQALDENPLREYELLKQHQERQAIIRRYLDELSVDGKIVFEELPVLHPIIRNTLLDLIGQASASSKKIARTDTGAKFQLKERSEHWIQVRFKDGTLKMKDFELEQIGGGNS
ncbi:TIGR02677 family protein [Paenibacillus glucanolyticus]|uniref:TIGR02677 family protein n=1 Tax=Paenibacillus glucanolyticus TaxID=59843 RepID=UPI0036A4E478